MFYSDDFVEEVITRNDILDIVSEYINLKKQGNNYVGLCPFHNEKSPSFSVSQDRQMYYCFGCHVGGNIITFLMEYENYTFIETIEFLASKAGLILPEGQSNETLRRNADIKTALLEIHKIAANHYYNQIKLHTGGLGYKYLVSRGLSEKTIKQFGLGYASQYGSELYKILKAKGYSDDLLKDSGLVKLDEKGGFDRFWNRVMFPIFDINNKVIAFGGRVMGDGNPKYLNSPETKIFDKSRNLYGLNYARKSREKYMLICEGYMDVIALHQAGFTNAVASLGTAFTALQANLLKRYTEEVILTYDSDDAGMNAALRAIPILSSVGIAVKVLNMKPHKDPDEFIKKEGKEAFSKRIMSASNSFIYEIMLMKLNYDMKDPKQKTDFYNSVARRILEFDESIERSNYTEAAARELLISYDDLLKLVNRIGVVEGVRGNKYKEKEKSQVKHVNKGINKKEDATNPSRRLLITWIIEDNKLLGKIDDIISPEMFVEPLYIKVADMVFKQHRAGTLNPASIINKFIDEEENHKIVASLFNAKLQVDLSNEEQIKACEETIIRIKKSYLEYKSQNIKDLLELQEIINEKENLTKLKIKLN
jgi:DNA primase, catalytic core